MTQSCLRVLIADDSALYRKIVRDLIDELAGVEVVAVAHDGDGALEKIKQYQPDLVVLDVEMPKMGGHEVLGQLAAAGESAAVIILSDNSLRSTIATRTALRYGAMDIVRKPDGTSLTQNIDSLRQSLLPRVKAFAEVASAIRHGVRRVAPPPPDCGAQAAATAARHDGQKTATQPVVVIGSSTGGPAALAEILRQLPGDFPAPVLIAQHMPPLFTPSLAADLDRVCQLRVREASHGEPLVAGHVLVAPGGQQMRLETRRGQMLIHITNDPAVNNCRPSVDYLFRSAAATCRQAAVGVILTGMGIDGTEGCRCLKRYGCPIHVQDEATSVVFGMPRQVIENGLADVVSPLSSLAAHITACLPRRYAACP